jgi:hypothetical protein
MALARSSQSSWRSATLALAVVNAGGYLVSYWASGWVVPHLGSYLCWIGVLISPVPSARELRDRTKKRAALLGLCASCAVLLHIVLTPCTGSCK